MKAPRFLTRRQLLHSALLGTGVLGLQSALSGIPLSVLRTGIIPSAWAEEAEDTQFLLLNTSTQGDPFNANVPGCYNVPGVFTNKTDEMEPTPLMLGASAWDAAKPWSTLPQWVLDRTTFIHHRTYQNAHPQYAKVMTLLGNVKPESGNGTDHLSALFGAQNQAALSTIQQEQVALGRARVSFQGRSIQSLQPTLLKTMLAPLNPRQAQAQALRDSALDSIHGILNQSGTPAQRQWLERHALSRQQARGINENLLSRLEMIQDNGQDSQIQAAIVMFLMKVSPVVTIQVDFGQDNHADADLIKESTQTVAGVASLKKMFEDLQSAGLQDKVTFANFNVFGRTLRDQNNKGRDHNLNHHVMMITGKHINPGVIGSIERVGRDFGAMAIDSTTGAGVPKEDAANADIQADASLESAAKTLARALAVPNVDVEQRINRGMAIAAALKI